MRNKRNQVLKKIRAEVKNQREKQVDKMKTRGKKKKKPIALFGAVK